MVKTLVQHFLKNRLSALLTSTVDRASTQERAQPPELPALPQSPEILGFIDTITAEGIGGWIYSSMGPVRPVLLLNGRCAELTNSGVPRPDVSEALHISDKVGYWFQTDEIREGDTVTLCALVADKLFHVKTKKSSLTHMQSTGLSAVQRIRRISEKSRSTAITCWDGSHNPLGRAKVLYDVAQSSYPGAVAMVTYIRQEFGGRVWPPLESEDWALLAIPWDEREVYHKALSLAGIEFDAVWICKPRLDSFRLAAALSGRHTRAVLDFDDDEEAFSRSKSSQLRSYGTPSLSLAKRWTSIIDARTCASRSLAEAFSGTIVRHARAEPRSRPARPAREEAKILFLGTVRAHKGIVEAAKAIQLLRHTLGLKLRLVVRGIFESSEIVQQLSSFGAEVHETFVSISENSTSLEDADLILAGVPIPGAMFDQINRFQISAKIGDALAHGRPVLVPETDATRDLAGIDGVYLFTRATFSNALRAALMRDLLTNPIRLPNEFRIAGAAAAYMAVRELSRPYVERAAQSGLVDPYLRLNAAAVQPRPTLLLLWKQHDAGLYGRRIDQIARSYQHHRPDARVVVLEIAHKKDQENWEMEKDSFFSEKRLVRQIFEEKMNGRWSVDGVEYRCVETSLDANLGSALVQFLVQESISPNNTVVIAFPVLHKLSYIRSAVAPFRKILDIVDNQVEWEARAERRLYIMAQYAELISQSRDVVFNSEVNRRHLENALGPLLTGRPVHTIPNWYRLRTDAVAAAAGDRTGFAYSGNMNDRVDWKLLLCLADRTPETTIHLIGTAARAQDRFFELIERDNVVYHGPLQESDAAHVMSRVRVGLVPHIHDGISSFMNPLKVEMYRKMGLGVVATRVPGLPESIPVCHSHDEFIDRAMEMASGDAPMVSEPVSNDPQERAYCTLIDEAFASVYASPEAQG